MATVSQRRLDDKKSDWLLLSNDQEQLHRDRESKQCLQKRRSNAKDRNTFFQTAKNRHRSLEQWQKASQLNQQIDQHRLKMPCSNKLLEILY